MFEQKYGHTKAAVTVAEMSRMVGLSRARFYQLMGNAFPFPDRDSEKGRPYYTEEKQKICLEVRRRNCGIDGKAVLFYTRRGGEVSMPTRRKKSSARKEAKPKYTTIADAIRALGLAGVTDKQIDEEVLKLFPNGIGGAEEAEVIRSVFVSMKRQFTSDNLGR